MTAPLTYPVTVDTFKKIARAVRAALAEFGVSLRLTASYDLLAHTLVDRHWSQLAPALPQPIEVGGEDQLFRMLTWLHAHGKMLTPNACSDAYADACDLAKSLFEGDVFGGWTYNCDLGDLHNQVCPLYVCAGNEWDVYPAYIVIVPDKRIIYVEIDNDLRGSMSPLRYNGREYEFRIESDILGSELVNILRAPEFLARITRIADDYDLVFDGQRWKGELGDDGQLAKGELYDWLSNLYPETGTVYTGDEYMDPIFYGDDGETIGMYDDEADTSKIIIYDRIEITSTSDFDDIYSQIKATIPENIEVRDLTESLRRYFERLS